MTKPLANVLDLPLEERAEMTLNAAVEKVILESAREGRPIYVWRDSAVVEVSVEELRERAARISADSGTSLTLHRASVRASGLSSHPCSFVRPPAHFFENTRNGAVSVRWHRFLADRHYGRSASVY